MPLIKAAVAPPSLRSFSMTDIENQARAILLRAQQQARELLAGAQAEAEALKEQAHVAGLATGRAEGRTQGHAEGLTAGHDQALAEHRAQFTAAINTLSTAAKQIDARRREIEAAALHDVIGLAIAIAERVTKRLGRLDPTVAVGNVAEALKLVAHTSDIRIAIHPSQKATLERELPALRLQWPTLKHVELVEDAALAPGGCRIHTAQGQVSGDLDEQISRVVGDLVPEADVHHEDTKARKGGEGEQ